MHRNYQSKFEDLDPTDGRYAIKVYQRVMTGKAYVNGHSLTVKTFPNGFWSKETATEVARYVALELNHWNREQVCRNLTTKFLRDNCLAGVCKQFGNSTYAMISACFPEWQIKPWELLMCPNAYWKDIENCAAALRWVAQKEGIEDNFELFCDRISYDMLRKYHVGKAAQRAGGLYQVIEAAYPGKYKPWNLKKLYKITDDLVRWAVTWMIEDQLHWSHDEVCENICVRTFYEYGIGGVLSKGCDHSPIVALQKAYPGEYERYMLKNSENPFRR